MRPADTSDLWWRTAVIYCLDIETFQDSDGDGVGDIAGLCDRIDYLSELGVTCLWLMPFQPTRDLDDGYDITDFTGVDPRLGDLGGFVELLRIAHDRGIRVIMDLVVNHTSDRHPWFRSARRSRSSRHRNYYVWRDRPPRTSQKTVFPGEEDSVWEHDERTDQYYLHSFYRHQPDLNLAEPAVRAEIARVVGFWTELGVDGFRLDAVPFLISPPGAADDTDPHAFLRELHRFVGRRRGGAALLGEVGLPHDEQLAYFGDGATELELQFDFATMQAVFLSLVRGEAAPLARVLGGRPVIDQRQGWAMFLRNHDELTLEQLTEKERAQVFDALAPDERQRVYGRGIVRRLAPMLHGDPRRIRQAYSLLFSLPGAPVLLYGEEIGMGEIPATPDRAAIRTPMQWHGGPSGGFSTARPSRVPPIPGDGYAPAHVNVHDQLRDPDSLLSFIRLLIARYRSAPEIAWGELSLPETGDDAVLAHACRADDIVFLAVHNLVEDARTVEIEVPLGIDDDATVTDLLSAEPVQTRDGRVVVELEGYGFRWVRRLPPSARRP
ncbi:alpha-amylase family protein [Microbacterium sp. CIAB417]|uniref:alpha-amylase family protein n=1 Tax=Microbacterium sp. CIAB417 TaxID=2860287 RepID=UPI001FAC287A|nr:alpha-amylase family protein [Microbacterium sp. CIAB417]